MKVSPVPAFVAPPSAGASSSAALSVASSDAPERIKNLPGAALTQSYPGRLTIEFDEASQRFVQTLLDGGNEEILRRYPNEEQLAFSRGVSSYVRAFRFVEFQLPG